MWVLFGGVGVGQGCLVWLVCCVHGHGVCVGCGGRREQDMVGVGTSVSRRDGDVRKGAPSFVYRRREGQVRTGGGSCVAVPAWCTWHGRTAWLGVARHVDGCGLGCCVWRGEGKREGEWRAGLGVEGVVGCLVEGWGVAGDRGCVRLMSGCWSWHSSHSHKFVLLVMLTNAREKALGHARARS